MNEIVERIGGLSRDRMALLQARLREKRQASAQTEAIPKRRDDAPAPLSFGQERLWLIDQLQPGSPAYNMPAILPLSDPLDVHLLERALNEIVARHAVLRTTFQVCDGEVVQIVSPQLNVPLEVLDLQPQPGESWRAALRRVAADRFSRAFDLARGPLIRATLLRLPQADSASRHRLLLSVHHIVADAWSMEILFRELALIYSGLAAGSVTPPPADALQYADFAMWQRERLQGQVLDDLLTYWKGQIADAPALLKLPSDRPRPAAPSFRGATVGFDIAAKLTEALRAIGQSRHATLFMTMLAAFQALLFRYTGESDFVVGTPIANRGRAELENMVGFFLNTLVLRADLSAEPSFETLLDRVRRTTLDAYAHQELPFELLVKELRPARKLSVNPLFQVMFVLQSRHGQAGAAAGAERDGAAMPPAAEIDFDIGAARFDLTLSLVETGAGLSGLFEYSTDQFDAPTIVRMAGHFRTLLEGIVADPGQPISKLPLLSQAERRQLADWNRTAAPYPLDLCIHELFERQVAAAPNAIALAFGETEMTYGELDRRANQLAHRLRAAGVGAETIVGLCVERSVEMVTGLLGILKAGGAYLPLDPSYPPERLAYMARDAGIAVAVTQACLESCLPASVSRRIRLDADSDAIAAESAAPLDSKSAPDNAAYVIYTSGSTGKPKGVVVLHRGAVNSAEVEVEALGLRPDDRILQFASLNFDASVFELLMWMRSGATLCLAQREEILPGPDLLATLHRLRVTLLPLPPSALAAVPVRQVETLRTIVVMGEACPAELVARWKPAIVRRFFNAYGPTEASMWVAGTELDGASKTTIGRPIANNRIYILDRHMAPVPVGVPGQIHVAGVGVTRGYHNRPALTAERFLPDPFAESPGGRLYATGDLARYLPDGRIEFLGRADHQVKVRGYRIELGEVEAALAAHPAVVEAVVVPDGEGEAVQGLLAYAVVAEPQPEPPALRQFLMKKLPDYMVPSQVILLESLPLTSSGKVDRGALPTPAPGGPPPDQDVGAFDSPVEEALARIWMQVLRVSRVGPDDDFFELGGHSLLAAQIISRVRDRFGVELPVRRLFDHTTLAMLARAIEAEIGEALPAPDGHAGAVATEASASAPSRDDPNDCYPASYAQERLWFLHQLQPDSPAYNISTPLPFAEPVDVKALERALRELLRRHEALRTSFAMRDGRLVQVVEPTPVVMLPVIDLRPIPEEQRPALFAQMSSGEAFRAFDLGRAPIMRAVMLRLGEEASVLLLTVHHIVADGWSMGIIVQELQTLYEAFRTGQPVALPKPAMQYKDYAMRQRAELEAGGAARDLAYWKRQLAEPPTMLQLPLDRPRQTRPTYEGALAFFSVPAATSRKLKELGHDTGATLFVVLLSAFAALLHRYSGQGEVVVGTPVANRARSEHERLVGLLVNTVALRCDLSDDPRFYRLVERIQDVSVDAQAHQALPFEMLVTELGPSRDLNINPLFQAFFAFHHTVEAVSLQAGGTLPPEPMPVAAKFDLSLHVAEGRDNLFGAFEYKTALFDTATVRRLIGNFEALLEEIAEAADRPVSHLPLLCASERELLRDWNDTTVPWDHGRPLSRLIEEQAAKRPDAPALIFEGAVLSYADLNRRANCLARRLRALRAGAEALVGIHLERSFELVVALVASLKAGCAFVPLDPGYPKGSLAFMAADTALAVLITSSAWPAIPVPPNTRVIGIDQESAVPASDSAEDPADAPAADGLAYVLYTSGSTGRPKGVMVPHRALMNRLLWMQDTYRLTPEDRVLQKTPCSFDVALWEFFWPLMAGASLVLAKPNGHRDPAYLAGLIEEQRISHLHFVPSMLHAFLDQPGLERLSSLKRVICSGEALPIELQRRFATRMSAELHNLYGPTEAAIDVTAWPCDPDAPLRSVPIGRPIANTQIHLLDRHLRQVPVGAAGELYIGGVQVGRGYYGRPGLTAERFIPDPFAAEPGSRLYRTGDLARHLPDGAIEFLGRLDHQVKVRGARVELGEVEAALAEHPAIAEAVVLARDEPGGMAGAQRLVAYLWLREGKSAGPAELRAFLEDRLPAHMAPSTFITMTARPLTPNGKLDRKALPEPDLEAAPSSQAGHVAPQDAVEAALARVWGEVLGIVPIGRHDNFFLLGGHSLKAMQVIARLRDHLEVDLPVARFFDRPTLSEQAKMIGDELDHDGQLDRRAELFIGAAADLVGGAAAPRCELEQVTRAARAI